MDRNIKQEVSLKDGSTFYIEVESEVGFEDVSMDKVNFTEACKNIKQIGSEIYEVLKELAPQKGSVEFGVELGVESGKLISILVNGSGKATLNIKLEWEK